MFFLQRLIAFVCLVSFITGATLPIEEVESLRVIARTLGKTDWNFSADPCSVESGWNKTVSKEIANEVGCNCSFVNYTVCHVTSIVLKSQNLRGRVPPELVRLPFLQVIDLTRNYLSGIIPPAWGSMGLTKISLVGNRITGPLPRELANISTLTNLTLEYNQLSGNIPPEFGNFSSILQITLSSNNLTGELPESLGRLTTLKDFRISDNNFNGSIPSFIQNWTNIDRIAMQASGLSGPIPLGIASLTSLTDLRISDLNGNESTTFLPIHQIRNFKNLILRSCNIVGELLPYIGNMSISKILDLSFNHLHGPIPDVNDLEETDYIYLTGNSLNGSVPNWMLNGGEAVDLSYNNFTFQDSDSNCQTRALNMFASSKGNTTGVVSCLRAYANQCRRKYHSLRINCGGGAVDGYEEDTDPGGASNFFRSPTNWGFSSTGHFLDDGKDIDSYIQSSNASLNGSDPHLYINARLSPLSLTYYGFCMHNGSYNVGLHFAEILYTNDRTFRSLGRRVFDIYIQGHRVKKDFNIENEAGGVNKAIIRNFTAVVIDNTLDIRLYWAGKGTDGIPSKGKYGPLISAISVNPKFPVPSENGTSISTGLVVGIVFGVLTAILLIVVILWWKGCFKRKDTLEYELRGVDLQTSSYTFRQIKAATNNFDPANKIGEGGFGPVHMGCLPDGTAIAVKQLSSKSSQGNREFLNEIGMISALQHPHLVKLYGCCIEGNQLLLIYEYLENNSLSRALFGSEEHQLNLDWPTRYKICIGIARGLAYLHEESIIKVVHRDMKASNVLLDKNLNPKISDFGLAKLDDGEFTYINTRIAGTLGYMAPEYAMQGRLTEKADVYSYGVVLLEVVSGQSNISVKTKLETFNLLEWAKSLNNNGDLMELVDPRLEEPEGKKEEILRTINIAFLCTNVIASERPSMSAVVSILEGKSSVRSDWRVSTEENNMEEAKSSKDQVESVSMDAPWTDSSSTSTTADLYPLKADTGYWEKRSAQ